MKTLGPVTNARRISHPAVFPALGRHLFQSLMELICPSHCLVCSRSISDNHAWLCPACWAELQENLQAQPCPVCGHNVGSYALLKGRCHRCQKRRPVVRRVVRVGDYQKILRELILTLKFRRAGRLDLFLGDLLATAVAAASDYRQIDFLVPVPLHWRRRWSRGYDQAELLARAAATQLRPHGLSLPVRTDLVRIRHTPPQTSLSPTERLINLRGAFAVRPGHPFTGRHICLIDDVTTTGTTLRVAAQTLRKAGAKSVRAAVLAVAANN